MLLMIFYDMWYLWSCWWWCGNDNGNGNYSGCGTRTWLQWKKIWGLDWRVGPCPDKERKRIEKEDLQPQHQAPQERPGRWRLLLSPGKKKHPDNINISIRRGLFTLEQLLHLLYMLFHSPSQSRHFLCNAMQIASFPTSVDLGFVVCHLQCSVWAV